MPGPQRDDGRDPRQITQLQRQRRTHLVVTGQQLEDLHRDREARDQQREGAAEADLGGGTAVGPTQDHQREADDQEASNQHEVLRRERLEADVR